MPGSPASSGGVSVKAQYAAVPMRAMSDDRLTASHWRALAAVASHDRLGKNGTGCYASHETLAREAGIHYNNLSTALGDLASWGYLDKRRHPLNRRLRVYSVIYNDNSAIVREQTKYEADSSPIDEVLPTETRDEAPDSSSVDEVSPTIVRPEKSQTPEIIAETAVNIFPEGEVSLIHPVETGADAPSEGISLRSIEGKRDCAEALALQVERENQKRALEGRNRAVERLNEAIANLPRDVQSDVCALKGEAWNRALEEAASVEQERSGEGVVVLLRAAAIEPMRATT